MCVNDTIFIVVNAVNDAPVTFNENIGVCAGSAYSANILTNGDYDPEGTGLNVNIIPILDAANGIFVIDAAGNFTYTPNAGFHGSDMVIVSLCDNGYPLPSVCSNDTIFISVNMVVSAVAGQDIDWCNQNAGLISGNNVAGTSGVWTQLSGPNSAAVNTLSNNVAYVTGLTHGTYNFVYTLTSLYQQGNCVSTDTVTLVNYAPPQVNPLMTNIDVCLSGLNQTFSLDANAPISGTGKWIQLLGAPATIADTMSNSTTVTFSAAGQYNFVWEVTNGNCPAVYNYVNFNVNHAPYVYAGSDGQICEGMPFSITDADNDYINSFFWITSGSGYFSDPLSVNPVYYPSPADVIAGSVTLTMVGYGDTPCGIVQDNMILYVSANPAIVCSNDVIINTLPGDCSAYVVVPDASFSTTNVCGTTVFNSLSGSVNPSGIYGIGVTQIIWAAVYLNTDTAYCTQTITVNGAILAVNDTVLTLEDMPININVTANDISCNNILVSSVTVIKDPVHGATITNPATGMVTYYPSNNFFGVDSFVYVVCDINNMCDTATVYIDVLSVDDPIQDKEVYLIIPEGFSPNGDGINDYFEVVGIEEFTDNSLVIYNRWGNALYKARGYNNTWDGIPNVGGMVSGNNKVVPGTYYYILELNNKQRDVFKGYITIQY